VVRAINYRLYKDMPFHRKAERKEETDGVRAIIHRLHTVHGHVLHRKARCGGRIYSTCTQLTTPGKLFATVHFRLRLPSQTD